MSTPNESTRPLDGLIREDGYRVPPQRIPSPQLQLERTVAEARAHAAQAQATARLAHAAAQRAADQALTAKRWNTAAVLISTVSLGMAVAMLLGWL